MNGDVLSDLNFKGMINHHHNSRAIATVALSKRVVEVDYGVISIGQDNRIKKWDEKPDFDFMVSTGIYILESRAMDYIPSGKFFNLPDLIISMIDKNETVSTYQHEGFWLDIGRPDDYGAGLLHYMKT